MSEQPVTAFLCFITSLVTFFAFKNSRLQDRLLFQPERILADKEWYRLLSSALIHADWMHLGCNLVAFYSFGSMLEIFFGPYTLCLIYIGSILGGSLLSLFLHRNHEYSALGASGGVSGVVFASIFLLPGTAVGLFMLPFSIPGPIFAILYLVGTYFALRKGVGNIGHDAHFGGAIVGLFFALGLAPKSCFASPILFTSSLLFSIVCLVVLARNPLGIPGKTFSIHWPEHKPNVRYQRYDEARVQREKTEEIDRILDKIASKGMDSISKKERTILEEASSRMKKR